MHLLVALREVIRRIERENYLPVQSRVSRSGPGKGENEAEIDRPFLSPAERAARVQPRWRATYYHCLGAVGVGAGACERCDICGVSLSLIASGRELLHVHISAYISSCLGLLVRSYFTASVSTARCFCLMDVGFPTNFY